MKTIIIILIVLYSTLVHSFYYKRNTYGDGNMMGPNEYNQDYINSYYGFPTIPSQEMRRRPSFNLYPSQQFFRREHPFDFGPVVHRIGDANEEKTDRERVMEKSAKPGFWRQNQRETMEKIKKIINEKRMDMEAKHMQIRRVLVSEGEQIRSKFADLHKRLISKNNKMANKKVDNESDEVSIVPIQSTPELSKQAKKLEKEAKKIMENNRMSVETKQEKLDKLMLKAPESVKDELTAINDSSVPTSGSVVSPPSSAPLNGTPAQVQYPSQQSFSVIEARPIRISEDGQTIQI